MSSSIHAIIIRITEYYTTSLPVLRTVVMCPTELSIMLRPRSESAPQGCF